VIGLLGFKIPLAILPPFSLGAAIYFLVTANTIETKLERRLNTIANNT
jgi:hypothetical protein